MRSTFTGIAKVWKNTTSKGKTLYSVSLSRKLDNGTYENRSINASFIDKDASFENGEFINIKNGFLSYYNNKDNETVWNIVVMGYEKVEQGTKGYLSSNFTGKATVYKRPTEYGALYSVSVPRKLKDGTWERAFIRIIFNKDVDIKDRQSIDVKQCWLGFYTKKADNKTVWFLRCTTFDILEEETTPAPYKQEEPVHKPPVSEVKTPEPPKTTAPSEDDILKALAEEDEDDDDIPF